MSMSRKDFELLARIIKELPPATRTASALAIADALVGHVATFDKNRFLKACGVAA